MMSDERFRAELLERLRLRPCHVTGMHEPNHDPNAFCSSQKVAMLDELLESLDIKVEDITRELHEDCGWCHRIPSQEKYRERVRRDHRWAGVPIPPELAETAPDVPQDGDPEYVLGFIDDEYRSWQRVTRGMDRPEGGGPMPHERYWHAVHVLAAQGLVEVRDISVRLKQEEVA